VGAAPRALGPDRPLVAELGENEPDRGRAHARKGTLDVTSAKPLGRLAQDVLPHPLLLAARLPSRRGEALLEVVIGAGEDAAEVGVIHGQTSCSASCQSRWDS
jgi:hypothetical protein